MQNKSVARVITSWSRVHQNWVNHCFSSSTLWVSVLYWICYAANVCGWYCLELNVVLCLLVINVLWSLQSRGHSWNCFDLLRLLLIVRNFSTFYQLLIKIDIRTAKFLNKFLSTENSVCVLFENCTQAGLKKLYSSYGNDVQSVAALCRVLTKTFFCSLLIYSYLYSPMNGRRNTTQCTKAMQ